ncbi:AAA family ATPase [Methylobacterium sp. D54C]
MLELLSARHNVLLAGAPATGKSRLLAEVAAFFQAGAPTRSVTPIYTRSGAAAIRRPQAPSTTLVIPSPSRTDRKVFRTTLHQGSKNRDFITGIVPNLGAGAATQFKVHEGILYRASEHALTSDGASLLIVDEINRGPAVQVFGGAIVAMEGEKRLAPDGSRRPETQSFELLDPASGNYREYAFPHHLYILAAMNQADVSVEPLDVAFLRRWAPFPMEPDANVLRAHFKLQPGAPAPPATPATATDAYEAAVRAWAAVNDRIALGRGPEFRIGHGVLMSAGAPATTVDGALDHLAIAWRSVKAHVDEAFFGDIRGAATVLNAGEDGSSRPYRLEQRQFGEMPRAMLVGPTAPGRAEIYRILLSVVEAD